MKHFLSGILTYHVV